jgi:hypothetical protein
MLLGCNPHGKLQNILLGKYHIAMILGHVESK